MAKAAEVGARPGPKQSAELKERASEQPALGGGELGRRRVIHPRVRPTIAMVRELKIATGRNFFPPSLLSLKVDRLPMGNIGIGNGSANLMADVVGE